MQSPTGVGFGLDGILITSFAAPVISVSSGGLDSDPVSIVTVPVEPDAANGGRGAELLLAVVADHDGAVDL